MRITTRVNKLNEILMEGYLSFKYFAEEIVKEIEGDRLEIADFQQEWIDTALKYDNVAISASRGSGKSMIMGILFPLYIAAYNSNKSILIVSPTEERSFEILQKIRYVIENNPLLKFLKPEGGTGTWSKHKLDTSNHCQFYCRCLSPNVRGHHVNYLLLDEGGEVDDCEVFFSAVLPTIYTKNGKCIAIGTPTSNSDLLSTLLKRSTFKALKYPAISLKNGKLVPLWNKRFSISKLNRIKRTIGEVRFNREYLLNIVSRDNQPFSVEMLMSCQKDELRYLEVGDAMRDYFIGVDLAYSKRGDYTVFTVFEMQPEDVLRLVHVFRVRGMDIPLQETKLIELMAKFPPKRVVIDVSLFGLNMVNNLTKLGYPIEGYSFGGRGKRSLILFTLLKAYSDKKIEIPYHESARDGINGVKNLEHECSYLQLVDGNFASISSHDDCLKEGTLIKTNKGYIPIEDIKVGDLVLTHKNRYKPVEKCIKKDFNNLFYNIQCQGQLELELSYNHPIYVAKQKIKKIKNKNEVIYEKSWECPKDWKKNYSQISMIEELEENKNLIIKYTDLYTLSKNASHIKLKEIILNKSFAKFLGTFLADGWCVRYFKGKKDRFYSMGVAFNNLSKDARLSADEIESYLKSLNISVRRYIQGNCLRLEFSSKLLYFLLSKCYNKQHEKQIPNFAYSLGKDLKEVLKHWLHADGWERKSNEKLNMKQNVYIGATTSRVLGLSMRDIAFSVGKYAIIRRIKRHRYEVKTKDQYWVEIYEDYPKFAKLKRISEIEYGSRLRGITKEVKIDKENYKGTVYNLQIAEDESYIAEGHVVHNCAISAGMGIYAASKFKSCLSYGISNSSNIYKEVNTNYGGRNYKAQKEKYIEYLQSLRK